MGQQFCEKNMLDVEEKSVLMEVSKNCISQEYTVTVRNKMGFLIDIDPL